MIYNFFLTGSCVLARGCFRIIIVLLKPVSKISSCLRPPVPVVPQKSQSGGGSSLFGNFSQIFPFFLWWLPLLWMTANMGKLNLPQPRVAVAYPVNLYSLSWFIKVCNFSKISKIIKHNPGNYQVLLKDFRTTFIFLIRQM